MRLLRSNNIRELLILKKKIPVMLFLFLLVSALYPEGFTRTIQLQNKRMNGPDVAMLQRQLLTLGFKKTGAADGWYGPLTEGSVRTLQYYLGFPRDGRVTRDFWNVLFNPKQKNIIGSISIIANYREKDFTVTTRRVGTNNDFDEYVISTLKNGVKTVLFRHVTDGLIIFRFRLWYLADGVFIVQDVYYGDYKTYVYHKTAQSFSLLKNGQQTAADPAMEGIYTRVNEGLVSAGFSVPQLIPALPPVPAAGNTDRAGNTNPAGITNPADTPPPVNTANQDTTTQEKP